MYIPALRRISILFALVAASLLLLTLASTDTTTATNPGVRTFKPSFDGVLCNALHEGFSGPNELTPAAQGNDCPYDGVNLTEHGPGTGNDRADNGPPFNCDDDLDNDGDTKADELDDDCRGIRSAPAGSHPDSTTNVIWPRGHSNYSGEVMLTTTAPDWTFARGTAEEGTSTIPEGQVIAGLQSVTTLGMGANPCNSVIFPEYIFWNATTDVDDVVVTQDEGTSDRFSTLVIDDNTGPPPEPFPGQADADSPIVTQYPDFLLKYLDPDGSGRGPSTLPANGGPDGTAYDPVRPWSRGASATQVPDGQEWQILQLLVFAPGQLSAAFGANPENSTFAWSRVTPDRGWVNMTILNDPGQSTISVNPISDFCTELAPPMMVLGQPGGFVRSTTPLVPQTTTARVYTMSQRDTDGDGIENGFDSCPYAANIDDPYDEGGGAFPGAGGDVDMIDPACDPTPNAPTKWDPDAQEDGNDVWDDGPPAECDDDLDNDGDTKTDLEDPDCHFANVAADIDGDGYGNSADNCPLIANDPNEEAEGDLAHNIVAPDGGPGADGIGDPCDPDDADATYSTDGEQNFIFFGEAGGSCIGGTDSDNNGVCDGDPNPETADDADNDQTIAGSTYQNWKEMYMQTDPYARCSITDKHQAWPPDFDNNRTINILDIVQLTPPRFGSTPPGPPYGKRYDLDANGVINILDIVQLTPPTFGTGCTVGGYDDTNIEDGACGDDVDNSGVGAPNGSTDADDPDCHDTPGIYDNLRAEDGLNTCGDGVDNSGVGSPDGSTDADDPECHDTPGIYDSTNSEDGAGADTCGDASDNGGNDGDDTEDTDCYDGFVSSYNDLLPEDGFGFCSNGGDDGDNDGADTEDTDCYDGFVSSHDPTNPEDGIDPSGPCNDTLDNGGDGWGDVSDPDCWD
jgi:hypothetical protein